MKIAIIASIIPKPGEFWPQTWRKRSMIGPDTPPLALTVSRGPPSIVTLQVAPALPLRFTVEILPDYHSK
jgi:hypothetical protein